MLDPSEFIKAHHHGILSTHSQTHEGYPFGSLVPYIITPSGNLAIYISELAEHTKNLKSNPKASLTISAAENPESPSNTARVTYLANVVIATDADTDTYREIYQTEFNDAEIILSLPGFAFYELQPKAIRLISGFGEIKWLSPDTLVFNK